MEISRLKPGSSSFPTSFAIPIFVNNALHSIDVDSMTNYISSPALALFFSITKMRQFCTHSSALLTCYNSCCSLAAPLPFVKTVPHDICVNTHTFWMFGIPSCSLWNGSAVNSTYISETDPINLNPYIIVLITTCMKKIHSTNLLVQNQPPFALSFLLRALASIFLAPRSSVNFLLSWITPYIVSRLA